MKRSLARENAFILIFEKICRNDETAEEIFRMATEIRDLQYDDYIKQVFFGTETNAMLIGELIDKHSVGWAKSRISPVSAAIIRLGIYELLFMDDIPARVTINEAVELAKKYDDEKSYSFVNGVLNAVAKDAAAKTV